MAPSTKSYHNERVGIVRRCLPLLDGDMYILEPGIGCANAIALILDCIQRTIPKGRYDDFILVGFRSDMGSDGRLLIDRTLLAT